MIVTMRCERCGNHCAPPDNVTANLTLHRSDFCRHCHHDHQKERHLWFCSSECFVAWFRGEAVTVDYLKGVSK